MKASRMKAFTCLAVFVSAPSVAIAGGILDRITTGNNNNPVSGARAGDVLTDSPQHAVQGDSKIDDATLSSDVKNALKSDAQTSELDVKVKVRSGAVTLSGNAADLRWKSRAEAVAASVKGVRSVRNNMKIGS